MLSRGTVVSLFGVLASQAGLTGMAAAQETPAPRPSDAPLAAQPPAEAVPAEGSTKGRKEAAEEIVVTGTRIPRRKDLTTPAPIAVIQKEEMQASGKVSIGDFLQQSLPETGNAINTSFNNGGNGATRINLRSIGASRTLVLLNSRRFVPGGNGANDSVDLNSIPAGIIERIEVLKDGASAIYGSDAIAGVVNLITRKRMNGTEVTGYAGTSGHGDGVVYDLNATTGTAGDKGSILLSAGYSTQKPVFAGDRAFSSRPVAYDAVGTQTQDGRPGIYTNGSPTGGIPIFDLPIPQRGTALPNARVFASFPPGDPRTDFYNQLMRKFGSGVQRYILDPNAPDCIQLPSGRSCWRPYSRNANGTLSQRLPEEGGDGYNFAPANYLVTPLQRISVFGIGEAKFGDFVRGYVEGSYVNRQSDQRLAEEPVSTSGTAAVTRPNQLNFSRDNFYNPFGRDFDAVDGSNLSRRMLEFGPRRTSQDIDSIRIVAGVDGTLPEAAGPLKDWFWDVSLNYGRTQGIIVNGGNLRLDFLQNAIGPTYTDAGGRVHCGTGPVANGREPFPGCVPFNIFGAPGSPSKEAQDYIIYTGVQRGTNQLIAAQFNFRGDLFKLLSDRPMGLAAGYEYRIVSGENIPEPLTVSGQGTGNAATITRGQYYVNEGYGELSVPIVSGLPFIQDLEADAAVRGFNYNTSGVM